MTNYIHLRYRTPVETPYGTDYEVTARGGLTIAYALDESEPKLHIAYSKCSKNDLFNKKRGRMIAEGRLTGGHEHTIVFEAEEFNRILNDRVEAYDYVLGAMVSVLEPKAHADFYEMVSGVLFEPLDHQISIPPL